MGGMNVPAIAKVGLRQPNAAIIFVLIAAIFGTFFVFKIPLLWGTDETSHIARVYQLSQGHLLAQHLGDNREKGGYGGQIPESLYDLIINVNRDLIDNPTHNTALGTKNVDNRSVYINLGKKSLKDKRTVPYAFPNTAAYSPVAYVPGLIGLKIASLFHADLYNSIILIRLANLIFFIGCVYLALRILADFRAKWIIFVIVLLPTTLFEGSIISADTATNAVTFLFSALIIKALLNKGVKKLARYEVGLLLACTIIMPLLKPAYVLLLAAVFLLPNKQLGSRRTVYACKLVSIILAACLLLTWSHLTTGAVRDEALIRPGYGWQLVKPSVQSQYIVHHPLSYIKTVGRTFIIQDNDYFMDILGDLGFNHIFIPGVGVAAEIAITFLAIAMCERPENGRRRGILLVAMSVLIGLAISAVFYVTYTNVADPIVGGIQGRYFIELLPLSIFGVVSALGNKMQFDGDAVAYRSAQQVICLAVLVTLALISIKYYYITWG